MLKMFSFCVRVTFFSILVLVLGNWVKWDGKTISDQIKVTLSHAEETGFLESARNWAEGLVGEAKQSISKKAGKLKISEDIHSSERQKLKALIQELNSSSKKN